MGNSRSCSLSKFRNCKTKMQCRGYQIHADVSYFRTAARSIAFIAYAKPMWWYFPRAVILLLFLCSLRNEHCVRFGKTLAQSWDKAFSISSIILIWELSVPCCHFLRVEKGAVKNNIHEKALL